MTGTTALIPQLSENSLSLYLREIAKFPMLEAEKEYMLAQRYKNYGDVDAAHELTTSHLRLAAKVALSFRHYGLPLADLISEANIGLMQAIKKFDPEKGFRLSTYAIWWIKAAISDFILKSWSLVKIGTVATQKRLFYKKQIPAEKNIYILALYVCLFPQLIAGPIIKYRDIRVQFHKRISDFEYGFARFIIGLAKKVLIANSLGQVADTIFSLPVNDINFTTAWLGAFSYTFQIYYDFSGYSDMAIGLGAVFGFKFMENFNYPYISKTVSEFWRRWHISLSSWFKEYVYIPLGGSRVKNWKIYI